MANKDIKRTVSIFINDKEVKNTLAGVGSEIGRLKGELRQAERGSEEFNQKAKELREAKKVYSEMNDEIRETQTELQEADESMGGFLEGFGSIREGIGSGDLEMVKEGFGGIKKGIKGATRAALAFIATPIGAAIAALVAIGAAAKALWDYNRRLNKLNDELRALGVSALEMANVRNEVQATAETFDKEFSEIASKAKSLSETYGISMTEANDVIARGLADGGKMNEEFLDSLGEFDVFFQQAGYSAKEFVDIVNTGFELGIYSDKLPDAIKEAGLSLKEQTASTRAALVNAFGASFSDNILSKIKSGEMTVKDGLQSIADQAAKTGLTQQQQAQLTADIFRGAGEDAGGAMKILEAISKSTQREMTDMAKSELDVVAANERLNEAQSKLFEIGGLSEVWNNIKASAISAFADILNGFTRIFASVEDLKRAAQTKGQSQAVKDMMANAAAFGTTVAKEAEIQMEATEKNIKRIKDEIANLSWYQPDDAIKESLASQEAYYEELKKIAAGASEEMKKAQEDAKDTDTGGGNDDGNAAAAKKAAEAKRIAKEQAADEAQLAAEKKAREKSITDFIIAEHRRQELAGMSSIKRDEAQIKDKYAKQIAAAKGYADKIEQIEALRDNELAAAKEQRKAESQDRLAKIEEENRKLKEEAELDRQMDAAETQEEKEELMLEHQRELAQRELEILMEKKLAEAEIIGASEEEIKAIKAHYSLQSEKIDREFAKSEKKLNEDKVKWVEMTESAKLSAITGALGSAAQAFNEGSDAWKAIKISETLISTYQSATNAYNALAGIPVVGPALGAVAAGLAIMSGMKQVAKIKSTKLEKMPTPKKGKGKKEGGFTGKDSIGRDQDGNITGWVHEDEWVSPRWMTTNPKYAATIGWLENERQKGMSGYANGGYSSVPPPVPGGPTGAESGWKILLPVMHQLVNVLDQVNQGVHAKLYVGYEDAQKIEELNIERKQSEQNGTISQ